MLTISGLKRFYYIPGMTDMRCGYNRLLQIVKQTTHHDPYNGDVFVFMSKDLKGQPFGTIRQNWLLTDRYRIKAVIPPYRCDLWSNKQVK